VELSKAGLRYEMNTRFHEEVDVDSYQFWTRLGVNEDSAKVSTDINKKPKFSMVTAGLISGCEVKNPFIQHLFVSFVIRHS
jgi:hypothetical protein